jgi:hypothetical protein
VSEFGDIEEGGVEEECGGKCEAKCEGEVYEFDIKDSEVGEQKTRCISISISGRVFIDRNFKLLLFFIFSLISVRIRIAVLLE